MVMVSDGQLWLVTVSYDLGWSVMIWDGQLWLWVLSYG